jgi:Fe-S-cluster-containing hydrogenase component 2
MWKSLVCLTVAIVVRTKVTTQKEACVICHVCVMHYQTGTIMMLDQSFVVHMKMLHYRITERKEVEVFL